MNTKYSLIVIGAGITGLSTAIAWALNNDVSEKPVLVLEKNPTPGGYVTSFKRKGFLFDTTQLLPDASDLLEYLGIDIELTKYEGNYLRVFLVSYDNSNNKILCIPTGYDKFKKILAENYPHQKREVTNLMEYSRSMFNELYNLKMEPNKLELIKALFNCPKIVKNKDKTFREYFNRFKISNPEIKEIFDVFAAFSSLPAERAAALLTVGAMNTSLDGACRPGKGFIELPLKMKKRLLELGGELKTRCEVKRIIVEKGQVKGVLLSDGSIIESDYVVTTIDPVKAMKELVGLDIINNLDPVYANKVKDVRMSVSSISINLGLDDEINLESYGLDCCYNVITTGRGTMSRLFEYFDRGELHQSEGCFHLAVVCPSIVTGLKPNITIRVVPVPMADWSELRERDYEAYKNKKEKIAEFYINLVEKYMIPGLREHIIIKDIATPATFARYSGCPTGSIYDMAPYPDNFGRKRLKMRTPVKGLFQPKFSHGIWPSLQAGLQVVDAIMDGKIMNGYSRYRKK